MTEREFAVDVVKRLRAAGYESLWAGGCVRDELLGLTPKDYDVATNARPEEVRRLFRRTVAVGMSFGVVEVLGPRSLSEPLQVQVATFRSDVSYSDGRHPDAVVFASAREDALRRDFTINGMFFDPIENRLIDYVGGQEDLRNRVLRAIGDPATRFAEDKLRMLCAVRFTTCFDLHVHPATAEAVKLMAEQITVVSAAAHCGGAAPIAGPSAAGRRGQSASRSGAGGGHFAGAAADESLAADAWRFDGQPVGPRDVRPRTARLRGVFSSSVCRVAARSWLPAGKGSLFATEAIQ